MPRSYSAETRKILNDFLDVLSKSPEVDVDFLGELCQMMGKGKLEKRTRIQQAIRNLRAKADEF